MSKLSLPIFCTFMVSSAMSSLTLTHAADIKVTTTADEIKADKQCSLREAIAYLNRGISSDKVDTNSDCHPEDDKPSRKIVLDGKSDTTYLVSKEIKIKAPMTISTTNYQGIRNKSGQSQPTISFTSKRLFNIDDETAQQNKMRVVIQGMKMQGPYVKSSALTAEEKASLSDEGGIIFNREQLLLEQIRLVGGAAKKGGAIYNASSDAILTVKNAEFFNNYSNLGAAIFSELPTMSMSRSLVRENKPIDTTQQGFAVEIEISEGALSEIPRDSKQSVFQLKLNRLVTNTIFYANQVGVMTLKPGMFVNNITAVENKTGIDLETKFNTVNLDSRPVVAAKLSNSVILNSKEYDLKVPDNDWTFINNSVIRKQGIVNLDGKTKTVVKAAYQDELNEVELKLNPDGSSFKLIALDPTSTEEKPICRAPTVGETDGLFCPLILLEEEYLKSLKPRLLMSYQTLSESPIVNKGGGERKSTTNILSAACEAEDIRGEKRGDECDIGAFELKVNKKGSGDTKNANAEILYGEVATLDLKDAVGDGQLIPASECNKYVSNPPTDKRLWPTGVVGEWQVGCLLYARPDTAPAKGSIKPRKDSNALIYTPRYNFHGLDIFEYEIVTTTSRFSESANDRVIRVKSVVKQDPPNTFETDNIDLGYSNGTGSTGWASLLVLLGLYGYRRRYSKLEVEC